MRRIFEELIGRIIEAYVDDILVKSKKTGDLVPDLTEVFAKLRQHGVKLNPEKCVFRVPRGMLLGFVVSERGIEANLEKISAIMDMGPIKNLKGVQHITGCLAVVWTSLGPLPRWVPGPTGRWAPGTTRLALHCI
jgi:hypothetical protein